MTPATGPVISKEKCEIAIGRLSYAWNRARVLRGADYAAAALLLGELATGWETGERTAQLYAAILAAEKASRLWPPV